MLCHHVSNFLFFFRASDWSSIVGDVGEVCYFNQTHDIYGVAGYNTRVVNCVDQRQRIPRKADDQFCLLYEPKPPERKNTFVACCN